MSKTVKMKQRTPEWPLLPVSLQLSDRHCLLVGDGPLADRKQALLEKAGARIHRCQAAEDPDQWPPALALVVICHSDIQRARLLAHWCHQRRIPVNVAEQTGLSSIMFPSIIDRRPLLIAISSHGDAPVLTRLLRNRLEASLPHALGRLASLAGRFRGQVKQRFAGMSQRRRFWEEQLEGRVADLVFAGQEAEAEALLDEAVRKGGGNTVFQGGEVFLVGAGPGDPDLLTLKALRAIRQADVVLYDRLVSPEIMALVRRDARLVYVGKARADHAVPQEEINLQLVEHARAGHRVLRLKGGDPFIFGRGGEEIDTLAAEGIPFQIIPGITAASGCSSYSGIPLTHRDHAQSVRFLTGHLKNGELDLPWADLCRVNETLVFYMGLVSLGEICRQLMHHGRAPDTPVAVVSKGTQRDQRVVVAGLAEIEHTVRQAELPGPTIIIIGDVVRLRDRLQWFGSPTARAAATPPGAPD